jgi:hypothetical protein
MADTDWQPYQRAKLKKEFHSEVSFNPELTFRVIRVHKDKGTFHIEQESDIITGHLLNFRDVDYNFFEQVDPRFVKERKDKDKNKDK